MISAYEPKPAPARGTLVRLVLFAFVLLASVFSATIAHAAPQLPSQPRHRVTDTVGVLSPPTRVSLERRLEAYQQRSGHQIVVWIGATPQQMTVEEFAARTFEHWGVGRAGQDDGVAVFIFPDTRTIRIEVGYGLEDRVTDLASSRIIREAMAPRLQRGDYDGAVRAAVEGLAAVIDGGADALPDLRGPPGGEPQEVELTPGQIVAYAIIGLILLIVFITNPRLALWLLFSMAHRGGGGGYRGGGGGFGGGGFGGGRSGGGGATGGW